MKSLIAEYIANHPELSVPLEKPFIVEEQRPKRILQPCRLFSGRTHSMLTRSSKRMDPMGNSNRS